MIKLTLLILSLIIFSGCVNKHGISLKYSSECEEYYDLQGFYHKKCGKDDIVTYKEIGDSLNSAGDYIMGNDNKPKENVW